MKHFKNISVWLLLTVSITAVVFSSCKEDEIVINKDENNDSNTHLNADSISGTLTDSEGNTYALVKIGNQWWMAENLRVTKYNDGEAISNVTNNTEWKNCTTGAYCNINNNPANAAKYGSLYNWHAVATDKLAPIGWHVPTKEEWAELQTYLIANGYNYDGTNTGDKIAKSLAAKTDWTVSTNLGAIGNDLSTNNRTGFSAIPAGYRCGAVGTFESLNSVTKWWTRSYSYPSWYGILKKIIYDEAKLDVNYMAAPSFGHSVRCVMD